MSLKRINKGTFVCRMSVEVMAVELVDFEREILNFTRLPFVTYDASLTCFNNRTCRFGKGPTSQLLGWSSWRRYVPLASHYHGSRWLTICRRRLFLGHSLSCRLPIQASKGSFHHPYLPLQHQLERRNLPWYPQGSVESCSDYFQSPTFDLFPLDRPEPRRSIGSRHCAAPQERQSQAR